MNKQTFCSSVMKFVVNTSVYVTKMPWVSFSHVFVWSLTREWPLFTGPPSTTVQSMCRPCFRKGPIPRWWTKTSRQRFTGQCRCATSGVSLQVLNHRQKYSQLMTWLCRIFILYALVSSHLKAYSTRQVCDFLNGRAVEISTMWIVWMWMFFKEICWLTR